MRLSLLRWLLFTFLAFFVQTHFSLFGVPLNATIVLVYAYGLKTLSSRTATSFWQCPELKAAALGALVGFVEDSLSGSIVGPELFSKGTVGFLTPVLFTDVIFRWTTLLGAATLCLLSILDGLLALGLRLLFSQISISPAGALQTIAVQGLMNIAFGVLLKPAGEPR